MERSEFEIAVTNDPSTSFWLKNQFEETLQRDPVDALNDAQTLVIALKGRLQVMQNSEK